VQRGTVGQSSIALGQLAQHRSWALRLSHRKRYFTASPLCVQLVERGDCACQRRRALGLPKQGIAGASGHIIGLDADLAIEVRLETVCLVDIFGRQQAMHRGELRHMPVTGQHRQHASLAHAMLMSAHAQLTSRANDRVVYRYFSFPIHNNVTTASMMPTTTRTSQVSVSGSRYS
jgi:hypothetical protein